MVLKLVNVVRSGTGVTLSTIDKAFPSRVDYLMFLGSNLFVFALNYLRDESNL